MVDIKRAVKKTLKYILPTWAIEALIELKGG